MTLAGCVPPAMEPKGLVLMIHLFLDDSGKESDAGMPWVCMAGYLATVDQLLALNQKWVSLLLTHGVHEVHMKKLIPLGGMYEPLGWTKQKRDEVLADFVQAINKSQMVGVGVAVETAAWRKRKKQHPKLNWGTAQQFCVERILSRVIKRMHEVGNDQSIALVFDTDPEYGAARFNLFCALMGHDQRAAKRLSSITFGHPAEYPGLQCADILAWETRRELMHGDGGGKSTKRWQAMFANMPAIRLEYTIGEKWDDESFEAAMPDIIQRFSALRRPRQDG